jgi:hypothetical protein
MKRILLAALVAGWMGCSPGYESGKTKCSTSGTCPEGFVCNQRNLCVTEDSSGRGGTGGGGTGGGTGTPCAPSSSDTACVACGKSACCTDLNACLSNSACLNLSSCMSNCTTTSCVASCESTYPGGVSPALNLGNCLASYCSAECDSGGSTGSGGSGGSTGGTSGSAKIKFCHGLNTSSRPSLALTLNINGTKVTTTTGNCQPTSSCLTVSAGSAVSISLLDGSTTLVSGTINIEGGKEIMMRATLDDTNAPTVEAGRAQGICSGGTGTAGTQAKFCHFLSKKSTGDYLATLNIGGSTISAMSGTCAPIGSCTAIPSGTDVSISLLDGSTTMLSGTFPTIVSGANMVFFSELDTDGSPTIFGSTYSTGVCSVATAGAMVADPLVPMSFSSAIPATFSPDLREALREPAMVLRRDPASKTAPSTEYRSVSNLHK